MGTNYYMMKKADTCECCGRGGETEEIHLGKRSSGWKFSFKGDKANGVVDFMSWYENIKKLQTQGCVLKNEYGEKLELDKFQDMAKKWGWLHGGFDKDGKSHATECPSENDWLDPVGHSFSDYEFS